MSFAHSSPDPHRLPDPSGVRPTRAPGTASKLLMLVLLILAVVATVIMFFVDSEFWVNIAVMAALWAAFIGAVLVSRYSGVLGEEGSRIQALDARYQAELDAERAEHRRREVELENNYAAHRDAGRDETLESIRHELAAMREQLADLSGLDLTEEQVAVRARAERIIELERRSTQAASPTVAEVNPPTEEPTATIPPASPSASAPETRRGGRRGGFATGTFSAVRWSGTDSQDTAMIPLVVDTHTDDAEPDHTDRGEDRAESAEVAGSAETGRAAGAAGTLRGGGTTESVEAREGVADAEAAAPRSSRAPQTTAGNTQGSRRGVHESSGAPASSTPKTAPAGSVSASAGPASASASASPVSPRRSTSPSAAHSPAPVEHVEAPEPSAASETFRPAVPSVSPEEPVESREAEHPEYAAHSVSPEAESFRTPWTSRGGSHGDQGSHSGRRNQGERGDAASANHTGHTSRPNRAAGESTGGRRRKSEREDAPESTTPSAPAPTGAAREVAAEPVQEPVREHEAHGAEEHHHRRRREEETPENPHGRRRVEERDDSGAVTVAELMAQLKKNSQ